MSNNNSNVAIIKTSTVKVEIYEAEEITFVNNVDFNKGLVNGEKLAIILYSEVFNDIKSNYIYTD
mgnify:CR=1 FL=1